MVISSNHGVWFYSGVFSFAKTDSGEDRYSKTGEWFPPRQTPEAKSVPVEHVKQRMDDIIKL